MGFCHWTRKPNVFRFSILTTNSEIRGCVRFKFYIKHVPSFFRDTNDFLNHISEETFAETTLVSFHVKSLYSNIPNNLGIEAITYENIPIIF